MIYWGSKLQRQEYIPIVKRAGNPRMQKKASQKKLNKTASSQSKKHLNSTISTQNMMKEIGELKKQLVSIKSKQHLQIMQTNQQRMNTQTDDQNIQADEMRRTKEISFSFNDQAKQNNQKYDCNYSSSATKRYTESSHKKKLPFHHEQVRVYKAELLPVSGPRNREAKLKLSIQLNRIKSSIEKISIFCTSNHQLLQVLISQFNTFIAYTDSTYKDYEHELSNKKQECKSMREELNELSDKIIKMVDKFHEQKHIKQDNQQNVNQLKRHLSYYIEVMKNSQQQSEKYTREYHDLQLYVKELESSNRMLRKQVKILEENKQEINEKLKVKQSFATDFTKKVAFLEQDLHAVQVQCDKLRDKKKEVDRTIEKSVLQIRQLTQKLQLKDHQLKQNQQRIDTINKQAERVQKQQNQLLATLANKKAQIDKLTRDNTLLAATNTQSEDAVKEQESQIIELRRKLEAETRTNQKLSQSLKYCQMEIDNLSQEIDDLRKANERYKNQCFRNKIIGKSSHQTSRNMEIYDEEQGQINTFRTDKNSSAGKPNRISTHSKNRTKIMDEIQELIQKHRNQTDSDEQGQN